MLWLRSVLRISRRLASAWPVGLGLPDRRDRLGASHHAEQVDMLEVGQEAPAFSLPDAEEHQVTLDDFRGMKVLLWFFPKADTPG